MNTSRSILYLTAFCFVLGILVMGQFRSTLRASSVIISTGDQARVLTGLVDSNDALREEIQMLETTLARIEAANREESRAALIGELNRLAVVSGAASVSGPGVRLELSGQINPLDLQDLINELRNAGAEAIALNGRRIIVRSVVSRAGNSLQVDNYLLAAPYVLEAIGNPETIEKALLRRGGLVGLLEFAYPGLKISVTKPRFLELAARDKFEELRYAQPAR